MSQPADTATTTPTRQSPKLRLALLEHQTLTVYRYRDPAECATWMDVDSDDWLIYLAATLGPTSTLMAHRFAAYLRTLDSIEFTLADLGETFGTGTASGCNNPTIASVDRLVMFGIAFATSLDPVRIGVRTKYPPLSARMARKIPAYLQADCPYLAPGMPVQPGSTEVAA